MVIQNDFSQCCRKVAPSRLCFGPKLRTALCDNSKEQSIIGNLKSLRQNRKVPFQPVNWLEHNPQERPEKTVKRRWGRGGGNTLTEQIDSVQSSTSLTSLRAALGSGMDQVNLTLLENICFTNPCKCRCVQALGLPSTISWKSSVSICSTANLLQQIESVERQLML